MILSASARCRADMLTLPWGPAAFPARVRPRAGLLVVLIAALLATLLAAGPVVAQTPTAEGVPRVSTGDESETGAEAPRSVPRGIATGDGRVTTPASPAAPAEEASAEDAATEPSAAAAVELLELLRDREVRDALLRALTTPPDTTTATPVAEAAEAADARPEGDSFGEAAPDADAAPPDAAEALDPSVRRTLGRRIAETTTGTAEDVADAVTGFWNGLVATQRRLGGLARADVDEIRGIAETIAITLATTLTTFLLLRALARPFWRRLAARAGAGTMPTKTLAFCGSVLIDEMTIILAWASGYAIALYARGSTGEIDIHIALFLNAFLGVETVKLVLRSLLSPRERNLRPLPLSDDQANYWAWWGAVLIATLGYGQLMVVPVVNDVASIFTGRAAAVVIYSLVLIATMVLVIRHRREPATFFDRAAAAQDGDLTLQLLASVSRYLWIGIVVYLFSIFVFAVTEAGRVGPIVEATLYILGIILIGAVTATGLSRASARGVRVPDTVKRSLPMLERRLNTFVPAFLKLMRLIILLAVVGAATEVLDLFDLQAWLDSAVGGDAAGRIISVLVMILAAFGIWLALTSWIDYRLLPKGMRMPTAREQTLLTLLRNAGTIAIIVVTLMFSLSEIGIDIAPLIASAGVLGLAIGFGAQKMVQDIIGGIFIQFENAINVGDVVTVGGTTGTVEKLTIRSVSLRDLQGVFHVIPFSSVDMVSNYMRGFAYHVADLGIAYREDIDEAKAVMEACFAEMREDPDWRRFLVGDFEWFGVQSLGDSAVVLRGRIKTTPGNQWGVGRQFNERLKKACDAAGIEIPFPHMTIWMGEGKDGKAPPIHVRPDALEAPALPQLDSHARLGAEAPASDDTSSIKPRQDAPLEG